MIYRLISLIVVLSFLAISFSQEIVETGFLRNRVGLPLTKVVQMDFRIYQQSMGGASVWDSGPVSVSVNEGLYTVSLGRNPQPPITEATFSTSTNYYMEYVVEGETFQSRDLIAHQARAILADKSLNSDNSNTANIALLVDWSSIANKPLALSINNQIYISTSNYALTSNIAISMNAKGLMGVISISSNGMIDVLGQIHATNLTIDGVVTANAFVGNGSKITLLNWDNIYNIPTIVTMGMLLNTANMALTSNIAISMNAMGLMGAISVSTNGNVGAGTNTPSTKLEVVGVVSASAIFVNGTVIANNFVGNGMTITSLNWMNLSNMPIVVTDGMMVNTANLSLTSNIATSMNAKGLMGAISVLSNGNVGINRINPLYALDVSGQIHATSVTIDGVVSASAFVGNGSNITSLNWLNIQNMPTIVTTGMTINTATLSLTSNIAISMNARGLQGAISVSTNGNVGINQVNPLYELDVNGQIHATSVTVDGVVSASAFAGNGATITSLKWENISNPPSVVTAGMMVNTANLSLTSNIAISMNAKGLMGAIFVSSNGNIGIGTTNPLYPLDVNGQIHATSVTVDGIVSASAFVGDGAKIVSLNWSNIANMPSIVTTGMVVNTANLSLTSNIAISMNAKGLMGAIFVSSNGNIGFGTTNPLYPLDVNGQIHATSLTVDGVVSANRFVGNGAAITSLKWENISNPPNVVTTGMIIDYANSSNYAITSNVAITAMGMNASGLQGSISVSTNGNVGIGTINPLYPLDVNGTIHGTSLTVDGVVSANSFIGDGSLLTGIIVSNILTNNYTGNVSLNGVISANGIVGNGSGIYGLKRYYVFDLLQPLAVMVTASLANVVETGYVTMIRIYTKDGSSASLQLNVESSSTILGSYTNLATISLSSQSNLDTYVSGQKVNGNDYLRINMTSVTTTGVDIAILVEVTKM